MLWKGGTEATFLSQCVPDIIMLAYQIQLGHQAQYLSTSDSIRSGNSPRSAEATGFSEVGYPAMSGPWMQ